MNDSVPPTRPPPAQPLATLYERSSAPVHPVLSQPLQVLYGGDLAFPTQPDRPYVVANFVQTLDGVVSFAIRGRSGGGEISGFDATDRFVMGLLRSCADAVMVGSGTLHADAGHVRTPSFIYPEARDLYAAFRAQAPRRSTDPLNVIVTGTGRLDLSEPTFHTPGLETLVVTTTEGEQRLRSDHGHALRTTQVRTVAETGPVAPAAVIDVLRRDFGVEVLLHEGGPRLLGAFLAAGCLDELFLTVAPQIAGREGTSRPGLAEGTAFLPETAPWFDLESIKRAGNHIFLRISARVKG